MDIGPHALAKGLIDALMTRNQWFAAELGADDDGLKMMSVAADTQVLTRQIGSDPGLDLFGSDHG